jgi:hypothetical protein
MYTATAMSSSQLNFDQGLVNHTVEVQTLKQKMFIICDNCFWCASALSMRRYDFISCPQCKKPLSSLPISNDETYRFNYDQVRGVELHFYSTSYQRK